MEHVATDWFLLSHKMLGFVTVLIVGPTTLLVTVGGKAHRRALLLYFVCMTLLYLSGSYFTFTRHDLLGWKFARNLTFNGFGYLLLVLAYRAVPLKRAEGGAATRADRSLNVFLVVLSLAMLAVSLKRWPMAIFGVLGLALAWMDRRELQSASHPAAVRLDRHIRYMMASYYYVVTVLSILLLPAGLKIKWAWPSAVALAVVLLLTRSELRGRLGWSRTRTQKNLLRFSSGVAFSMGAMTLYKLASEGILFAAAGG